MDGDRRLQPVGVDIWMEICRFLADEAALLDRRAFADWFALLTDDIVYRITTHVIRPRENGERQHEIVDEDWESLRLRVDQLADPRLTRAENPPSLYRRFVSNIRTNHMDVPDSFAVEANLMVYKNRPSNREIELYVGERHDVLRRVEGQLRIASRLVRLDQSVLAGGTLSTLL